MAQEDKTLLFQDLCARLPYGVKVRTNRGPEKIEGLAPFCHNEVKIALNLGWSMSISDFTPYLRPMSSMTGKEHKEARTNGCIIYHDTSPKNRGLMVTASPKGFDWLNKKMFDYRGLIEEGLALEAPKDMYK